MRGCGLTRRQAFHQTKDRAGISRSQQFSRQWQVGDDPARAGSQNYRYSGDSGTHGRYYEYDTPQGKRVIVDHTNDPNHPKPHMHAGQPKHGANQKNVDFKQERYEPVGGIHHIYYDR